MAGFTKDFFKCVEIALKLDNEKWKYYTKVSASGVKIPGSLTNTMPLYDYRCDNCQLQFEVRHGYDAETQQECPSCKGIGQRQFHASAVIYKGTGFYSTDYK